MHAGISLQLASRFSAFVPQGESIGFWNAFESATDLADPIRFWHLFAGFAIVLALLWVRMPARRRRLMTSSTPFTASSSSRDERLNRDSGESSPSSFSTL